MRRILLAFLIVLVTASIVGADTVYLRDGRTIRGTVLGFVDGRFVVRTGASSGNQRSNQGMSSSDNGIQYFDPQDVQRIEIDGRSLDEARFQTNTISVTLGANWVDSGVMVRRGQRVKVTASGVIEAGRRRITPSGLSSTDPDAPLPNAPEGELIGSIGNDPSAPIIEFGTSRELIADNDGDLFFTINRGNYSDVRGAYNLQILTERTSSSGPGPSDTFGSGRPNSVARRVPQQRIVTVPGNSQGTDTGIDLHTGDQVTVTASGSIVAGRKVGSVGPDGGKPKGFDAFLGELVGAYPLPNAGIGALGGFVQSTNGQTSGPFLIGSQKTFASPLDGRLFLMINDTDYNNHTGTFTVTIRY